MIKVLIIYKTCYPESKGGVEQVIRVLAKHCQPFEVETKILALSDNNRSYLYENSELFLVKKNIDIASNGFSFSLFRQFNALKQWADIIHYHYPWPTGDLVSLLNWKKPTILTYHSDIIKQRWLKKLYWPLERFFLNSIDTIVATSPQYAQTSLNLIRLKKKVKVIPLAIDPEDYSSPSSEYIEQWRQKVGSDFFLFIGVLRYYKGLTFLLEAAEINQLPVIIAGDGPLRSELEMIIEKKKLSNVKLVGFISDEDKKALLTLSKAFVFPSHLRSEAFGVSLLEALAYGKPLITSEVGSGSSYVNQDGLTGIITKATDYHSFSDAMIKISDNSELEKKMGEAGLARFHELFTADKQAKYYVEIYRQLLANADK